MFVKRGTDKTRLAGKSTIHPGHNRLVGFSLVVRTLTLLFQTFTLGRRPSLGLAVLFLIGPAHRCCPPPADRYDLSLFAFGTC